MSRAIMESAAPAEQTSAEPQPEPAAAEVEAPRRRLLRRPWDLLRRLWDLIRRLPTPLVATLLGVLLSAWLVPAFTQQWNDRQKARDVQAAIVADVVAATTTVLNDARIASDARVWEQSREPGNRTPDKWDVVANQWSVAVLRIKARLDIYLGEAASRGWMDLSTAATQVFYSASSAGSFLDQGYQPPDGRLEDLIFRYSVKHDTMNMREIREAFLAEEDSLASKLLRMHVQGYSTRWRDIASDLFPFV